MDEEEELEFEYVEERDGSYHFNITKAGMFTELVRYRMFEAIYTARMAKGDITCDL